MRLRPGWITRFFFFATIFSVTFEKVHWQFAGQVDLADILTILFLLAFVGGRIARMDGWLPTTAFAVLGIMSLLLLVYLLGYFNMTTGDEVSQFSKGLVKFFIHFLFVIAAVAYLARQTERFYWRTLGWFFGGMVFNAAYGLLQLAAAQRGSEIDNLFLNPVTGGAAAINVYGGVEGESVYRPNALADDPNHLGIILVIPLLVLTPLYLRLERGHRLRLPLGLLIAFLLVVEAATLSRSGILGLLVGGLVLLVPYRRKLFSKAMLLPVGGLATVVALAVASRPTFFQTVFNARTQTSGSGSATHFQVYSFVPDVLRMHPLLGLGLNNFSVYYEFITGKTNWGPHSFYVALFVETGIVGALVFFCFLGYVFWRLRIGIRLGKALAAARDFAAARVQPLAWGMAAALVGTMASNFFYLTMQTYYFYAFVVMALALPIVFGRRLAAGPRSV